MVIVVLIGFVLVAITVVLHSTGLILVLRWLRSLSGPPTRTGAIFRLLIQVFWMFILIHLFEIAVWALCYLWSGCLPDTESSFYFSGVSYTTIGYGDVVLPKPWRLLAPMEGLTGILMSGWSAGLFFALVSRIYESSLDAKRK